VTFKSNTGMFITNLISEDSNGDLFMTFTFSMPLPGIEPGSEAEITKKKELKEGTPEAVRQSLKATLKLFEEGKLH
jgi:hypothetical protein